MSSPARPVTDLEALPVLLTADEVASLLRTSRKAVYAAHERQAVQGGFKLGRRLLFRRDEVLAFVCAPSHPRGRDG